MLFKFSLIVATYGRKTELEALLHSLTIQQSGTSCFEVIVVDQNESDLLKPTIEQYVEKLNLRYIKSDRKGLSFNRNLATKVAKGDYLAFPDDDCEYYEDTLQSIIKELEQFSEPDMLIGKVYDRQRNKHVFKKTPPDSFKINFNNFYGVVSSITLFFKNNGILFDENFGVGEKYHSNEDGEIILRFLTAKKRIIYSPIVEFNHPPYDSNTMSEEKMFKYGIGFGAMCKKYLSTPLLFLFTKVVVYQFLMTLKEAFTFNRKNCHRRYLALKGRLKGFMEYADSL